MHRKMTASRVELAAKKAASNRGRFRGSGPVYSPKKVGLANTRLLGRLAEREAIGEDDGIMGYLEFHERKGESTKARNGTTFTLRFQTQIRHFINFFQYPHI